MQEYLRKRAGAKAAIVLLSIFLFLLLFASVAAAVTLGDINNDGKVNVQDVVLARKHVLGIPPLLTDAQQDIADVTGDGKVDVNDVADLMKFSLGLITEFKREEVRVASVSAVNGTVTVVLTGDPKTVPVIADFRITQSIGGAAATTVTPTAITWTAATKTAVLTVPLVAATTVDQSVVMTASYNLTVAKAAPAFIVGGPLAVVSVNAVNPKQVEVVFNRPLTDGEKAKMVVANFHVGLQAAPLVDRLTGAGSAVAVKEDGKTALLTLGDTFFFVNGSSTNRVVVKQAVGLAADHVVANLAFVDTSVPTLVSVETISPRRIVMTFSEPLNNTIVPTNITLNAGAVALNLAGSTYVDARRELIVDAFSDLPAGSHTLAILSGTSLRDYSGLAVAPTSITFTHTPVTTPPTVSVKSATESTVTLEFSRAIDATTLINNGSVLFRHTWDTTVNQVTGTAVTNPSGDSRTFVVNFGTRLLPPGSTTMWMKYADGTLDANKIKDTWGNTIPPATFTVTVVADTTAPTATVAMVTGSNTIIEITYSEPVQGAMTATNYSLKKGTNVVAFTGPVQVPATNKYRITATSPMQGVHTLTISNIKDLSPAENPMVTQTYTINVSDTIAPTVIEVMGNAAPRPDSDVIYVFYSEEMGTSALDLTNYRLVNTANTQYTLPVGTTITKTAATVKISLPDTLDAIATSLGSPTAINRLFIGDVKDLAGNTVDPMGNRTILAAAKFDANPTNVTVHSTSQVSFVVSRQLQTVTAAGIRRTTGPVNATSVSFINNADGTATITASFPAGTFATAITGQTINIEEDALTDLFGFKNDNTYRVGGTNTAITIDKAAPILIGAKTLDDSDNGKIDIIALEYSEAINPGSVSVSDYSVQGYTINLTIVVGNVVGLFLQESTTPDTGATPQVTQVGSIEDLLLTERNTLGPQPAITPVDVAEPVMISAVTRSANTVEITFSENVTNNNSTPTQYVFDIDGPGGVAPDTTTGLAVSGNKITLTLTIGGLTSGTAYNTATIVYTQGTNPQRTKDTASVPNNAVSPQTLTGVTSGF